MTSARLELTLFGGFQARLDGARIAIPGTAAQGLLAYLALCDGRSLGRGRLAALFWEEQDEARARGSLRQCLFGLRRSLGTRFTGLGTEGDAILLDPDQIRVDVIEFERAVADRGLAALTRAAALYRGDLLEDLSIEGEAFQEWQHIRRGQLRELAIEALGALLAREESDGRTEAAVQTALRLLVLDPFQEKVHCVLMGLYMKLGRPGAARRQFDACASLLHDQLGIDPEPETRQFYQALLRQRGSSADRAAAPRNAANPAPPLRTTGESSTLVPPLIGRSTELAFLCKGLADAIEGRGGVALTVGAPGIGKSRLLAEFAADAEERGARVLLGRANESEQCLPFAPWADLLRNGHIPQDGGLLAQLDAISRRQLSRLVPEIGDGVSETPDSDLEPLRLFESVAGLLTEISRRQAVVLILEDVHWADSMSMRLTAFIARRLHGSRLFLVLSARQDELADAGPLGNALAEIEREGSVTELALQPLSRDDTVTLTRTLAAAAADDAEIIEDVWLASEGHPLMIVEIVRALHETAGPERPMLPRRVRKLVSHRLDRLSMSAQQLVGAAAVLGREFELALLRSVLSSLDDAEIAAGLEELVRRFILHSAGDRLDFTHEAIRRVAYDRLLAPRLKLLHQRVATAAEAWHAEHLEPHYAVVGRHYSEAKAWDKAAHYLRLAGGYAVQRSAYREAVVLLEQARAAAEYLPNGARARSEEEIDIRLELYHALLPLGAMAAVGDRLREAERHAEALGDPARRARIAGYLTNYFWLAGEPEHAAEMSERAAGFVNQCDDVVLRVEVNFYRGQVHHFAGEYRRATAVLRENVEALNTGSHAQRRFRLLGLAPVLSRSWLAWSASEMGNFTEGLRFAEEALRLADEADHAFSIADACRALGCLLIRMRNIPRAVSVLERGLELSRSRGLGLWPPSFEAALGYAYTLAGRIEDGIALLEMGLKHASELRIAGGHALRTAWLGEALLRAGNREKAAELAAQAIDLADRRQERGNRAWSLRLKAEAARSQGDGEGAVAAFREAIEISEVLGMRPLLAHCQRAIGELLQNSVSLRRAAALSAEMGIRPPSSTFA